MFDDALIARTIESLLARKVGVTICPSDAARALSSDEATWRAAMPDIRRVAAGMASRGELRVTRGGEVVDAESGGGPIRLGRGNPPDQPGSRSSR